MWTYSILNLKVEVTKLFEIVIVSMWSLDQYQQLGFLRFSLALPPLKLGSEQFVLSLWGLKLLVGFYKNKTKWQLQTIMMKIQKNIDWTMEQNIHT